MRSTPSESSVGALLPSERFQANIRLKNVSFRYGITDPLVLEDINLEISPGNSLP